MDFTLIVGTSATIALFVLYWHLLFKLITQILGTSTLNKPQKLLVCIINTAITVAFSVLIGGVITPFIVMFALMIIEFKLFYKNTLVQNIFCTSSCIIHVLAIRVLVNGIFSLLTDNSVYDIATKPHLVVISGAISLFLLDIAVILVLMLIPLDRIRIINEHKEQQWFMVAWMLVNDVYLLYIASNFHHAEVNSSLAGNQIIASISILLGLYIILFFAIKTVILLGYQEKNVALKQAMLHEQQYRNSITKESLASFEVNVTQNRIVHGFEDLRPKLGDIVDSYSDMLNFMARKIVHSEDLPACAAYVEPANLLREFEHGNTEITMEYRRLMKNDEYLWARAVVNLIRDVRSGDLIAYVCVKDIDKEKRHQLELQQKAERDPLTGLYNKEITGKLINEHLTSIHEPVISALFIIDVDNFKAINDHLGHVYGDAVLCELSDKLRSVFRSNDIVGRIGGDEFIAYIKNIQGTKIVKERAEEVCKLFHITYSGNKNDEYTISSSIGISLFPKDGNTFKELYSHADAALYSAKSDGKNKYQIYDGCDFIGYQSNRSALTPEIISEQKSFRQNRIEYVFKILYQSDNSVSGIHAALELVSNHFSFERGYIFENSKDGKTTSNTFEWCADGVPPQISKLQNIPIETVATAIEHFHKNGTFILESIADVKPIERAMLEPQGIKSMFQFGIFDKSHLLGFIGFDNCRSEVLPCAAEIDEIATICNILATFFVKQHIDEVAAKDLQVRQEVMNHLDNYIYVVNPETFEVLFMNEQTSKLMNHLDSNTPCYSFFRGKNKQCDDCPIKKLNHENTHRATAEIYNDKLDIWIETTASTLRWTDGNIVCLVNCSDITEQKQERLRHINELERLAFVDELTGCRTFHKFKDDARIILKKQSDIPHFVVKIDIDNFKLINQIYGYEKGDEVLQNVAKALQQTARNEDEIFARVTNDEFVALFTFQTREILVGLYDIFLDNFNSLMGTDFNFQCVFPHGIFVVQPNEAAQLDIIDMFEKANVAHKMARQNKSLNYVVYDEDMTKKALRIKEIENKMTASLQNGEFIVYLQPKYYLDTEKIGGAEALARWENVNPELFYPGAFISIFEKNGFIAKLDFYILRKTCEIIKDWIANDLEPVPVSVNFSRWHLSNPNFVNELCEIVDSVGIDRKYIEIEITETAIYDNIDTLESLLTQLHKSGFVMSMDDFGSGYSSLGMLKDLPVDIIKMDRSFFANQKDAKRSKIVVGSIIEMAASLGIHIVAEGVEEQTHIDLLRELHCDMVQGYYYAKPTPVEAFTKLIEESHMCQK